MVCPALDLGAVGSNIDYAFTQIGSNHTLFLVEALEASPGVFLIGSSSSADFTRGTNGEYAHATLGNIGRTMVGVYDNSVRVDATKTVIPPGRRLISIRYLRGTASGTIANFGTYVKITGGTVVAEASSYGAGIGSGSPWNKPSGRLVYFEMTGGTLTAIRAVDPERFIMSDGWLWGRRPVGELHPMVRNVGESIHGYDPHPVTHYGVNVPKNGRLGPCPPWPPKGYTNGRDWLRRNFYSHWAKAEKEGCFLHLGEFGTYYQCPHATALAWMEDMLAVAQEKNLGWALWNLDGKFGLMDNGRTDCPLEDFEGHKLDRAMLTLLQRYAQGCLPFTPVPTR